MDVVILLMNYKVTYHMEVYMLYICCRSCRDWLLRARIWTSFAELWPRTRTFVISLSAIYVLLFLLLLYVLSCIFFVYPRYDKEAYLLRF